MYISLIDCVIYVWQSSKSVRRHEEEEIIQGKAESGNNDHSRSGRKEGRVEGSGGGSILRADRFLELLRRRDPEFLSACGMSID